MFSFLPFSSVSAAPNLNIEANVGISNNIKTYTPFSVDVTITNNGTAFSGDFVIDTPVSYSISSAKVYPLEIAEGETKKIQFYLEGLSEDYLYMEEQDQSFYFYEGGIESGRLIDYTGDKILRPTALNNDTTVLYTLTDNSNRLASLLRVEQFAINNVEIFHLNQTAGFQFPTDVRGLEIADILVIDDVGISSLTTDQQRAILSWIERGGTLLLGASNQVNTSMGLLQDYLPLVLLNEQVSIPSASLETYTNGGVFTEEIKVNIANETENSSFTFSVDDQVLAATTNIGNGQIIQTTFSLGDRPLTTMDGYPMLLTTLLQLDSTQPIDEYQDYIRNPIDYLPLEVGAINELFPSFEVSVTNLVIIVLIYILIIGPVLYFILKKMDKREHAWWIIPALSIALSIVLFVIGAKDRLLQSQIQQTAYYQVNDDESLSGYYVESILTNRGGDFTFHLDEGTTALPYRNYSANSNTLHKKAYVKEQEDGSFIQLKNLNYWSVESFIGESRIPNIGKLDIQLSTENNLLIGKITNHFPFELKDLAVWTGASEMALGNIKAGETINVSLAVQEGLLLPPSMINYGYSYPQTKEEIYPKRLEKAKFGASGIVEGNGYPVIIGWTDQALVGVELEGNATVSPVSYIAQPFSPEIELSGEVSLGSDVLIETIDGGNQEGYMDLKSEQLNEWYLEEGEYRYTVDIPNVLKETANWTEIHFTNKDERVDVAIFNPKTSEYEAVTEGSKVFSDEYIPENAQINFQIQVGEDPKNTFIVLPEIEIKGVAK